jgi:hypothetical protein
MPVTPPPPSLNQASDDEEEGKKEKGDPALGIGTTGALACSTTITKNEPLNHEGSIKI